MAKFSGKVDIEVEKLLGKVEKEPPNILAEQKRAVAKIESIVERFKTDLTEIAPRIAAHSQSEFKDLVLKLVELVNKSYS